MGKYGKIPDSADESTADGLSHLIEHIQDAVVAFELVDGDPVIVHVNETFVSTFGFPREAVVGRSLNRFLVPEWLRAEANELDARTDAGETNYRRVRRQTADGLREFLYRGVPYDGEDDIDGYAVYTDLTDIIRTERQLHVLHRVLRHNLRNEATVLSGHLDRLADERDRLSESGQRSIGAIRTAVDNVQALTENAGRINHAVTGNRPEPDVVDGVDLIESAVDQFRQRYPWATIETELPDSLAVAATADLRAAVECLLENAIEHNPASRPRVELSARPLEEEWIDLLIADDGPIIPETERDVLTGVADITPLQHGSGLGLWLAKWTVEGSGGSLSFAESELGGNCVRLRLRRAPEAER